MVNMSGLKRSRTVINNLFEYSMNGTADLKSKPSFKKSRSLLDNLDDLENKEDIKNQMYNASTCNKMCDFDKYTPTEIKLKKGPLTLMLEELQTPVVEA